MKVQTTTDTTVHLTLTLNEGEADAFLAMLDRPRIERAAKAFKLNIGLIINALKAAGVITSSRSDWEDAERP